MAGPVMGLDTKIVVGVNPGFVKGVTNVETPALLRAAMSAADSFSRRYYGRRKVLREAGPKRPGQSLERQTESV